MSNRHFFKGEGGRRRDRDKGFQAPKQIHEQWSVSNKPLYISNRKPGIPVWLIAVAVFLLIATLVFWAVPTMVSKIQTALHWDSGQTGQQTSLLYSDSTWVCARPVANLFETDDIKASRLTQVLYNEPVRIMSRNCTAGFYFVELSDGTVGYILADSLVDSRVSIEPDLYRYKLVIAQTEKRIMSHASQGTLLIEVPMGAVLYADYRGNGISRVALPDGQTGWISDEGVMVLEPFEDIIPVAGGQRFFTGTAMAFNRITVLDGGQSIYGISTTGIARLAGQLNGFLLPRLLDDLAICGQPVKLELDEESGAFKLDSIREADLVFLSDQAGISQTAVDLAICVGNSQVLYAGQGQSSIKLIDLAVDQELQARILFVRRLYE